MTHQCSVCLKQFQFASKLQRHHLTHSGHRPFACLLCGKAFRQAAHLKTHQEIHAKQAALPSKAQPLNDVSPLPFHRSQEGFPQLAPCTQEEDLGQAVQPRELLNTGQPKQHRVPALHWNISDRMVPTQVLQEQQLSFVSPAKSRVHLRTIALETFASVAPFQNHLLNQEAKEPTEPKPCTQTSDLGSTQHSTHLECVPQGKSHDKGDVKHQCSECSKCFSSPSKLRRHCLIHTGQRPFQCWECGGSFRQLAHLKTHQQTHKKPWGIESHTSEKMNQDSEDLKLQSESHVSPNSILCIPTSAVSVQPRSLQEQRGMDFHLLYRNDSRSIIPSKHPTLPGTRDIKESLSALKHISKVKIEGDQVAENRNVSKSSADSCLCSICLKSFQFPSKLRPHYLIHSGSRPSECNVCGLAFAQAQHLKKHTNKYNVRKDVHNLDHAKSSCNCQVASVHCSLQEAKPESSEHNQIMSPVSEKTALQLELNIMVKSEHWHPDICAELEMTPPGRLVSTQQHGPKRTTRNMKKNHQCCMCLQDFPAPSKLQRHLLIHTGQRPFSCDICGKRFRQLSHVKLHTRTHSTSTCVQLTNSNLDCYASFLPAQIKKDDHKTSVVVPKCSVSMDEHVTEKLATADSVMINVTTEELSKSKFAVDIFRSMMGNIHRKHQCKLCFKSFASPYKLRRHNLIHTGQKPFRCASCGKTFRQAVHLKVHQQIHGRLKPYKDALLRKFFNLMRSTTKSHFQSREVSSQGQSFSKVIPEYLPACVNQNQYTTQSEEQTTDTGAFPGKKTQKQLALEIGGTRKDSFKPRNYECSLCWKCFNAPSKLARHSLIHTGQRPFQCNICQQAFRQSSHLKAHHQVHIRMKPIHQRKTGHSRTPGLNGSMENNNLVDKEKVDIVGCAFPGLKKASLKAQAVEMSMRNDPRRFSNTRGKRFPRWNYRCSLCEKGFDSRYKLQRHYLTHTGHKPFACHVCGRKFRQSTHLKRHQQSQDCVVRPSKPGMLFCLNKLSMAFPEIYSHHESDFHKDNSGSHIEDQSVHCSKQPFSEKDLPVKVDEAVDNGAVNDDSAVLLPCVPQSSVAQHKDFPEETSNNCGASCPQSCSSSSDCWANQVLSKSDPSSPANTVKDGSRKDYQCVVCLKYFDSPSKLSRHFLIHTGIKPFECPFCAKAFRQLCHLRIHQQIHKRDMRSSSWQGYDLKVQHHSETSLHDVLVSEVPSLDSVLSLKSRRDQTSPPYHTLQSVQPDSHHRFPFDNHNLKYQSCELAFPAKGYDPNSIALVEHDQEAIDSVIAVDSRTLASSVTLSRDDQRDTVHCSKSNVDYQIPMMSHPSYISSTLMVKNSETPLVQNKHTFPREEKGEQMQHPEQLCEQGVVNCSTIGHANLDNLNFVSAGLMEQMNYPATEDLSQSKTQHTCRECHKCFSSPSKLKRHGMIHAGEKPFACLICDKAFRQASHLKCHQRIHTFPFSGLGALQEERGDLKEDRKNLHEPHQSGSASRTSVESRIKGQGMANDQEVPMGYWWEPLSEMFSCTHCHMVFFTEQELQLHSCPCRGDISVVKGSSYQCAVCFKDFKAPSKLKRHYVIHTGQRPFQCSLCGKTFTQSGHLKTHQLVHK